MRAGQAIRILVGGLAGAVILMFGSMLPNMVMGHDWLLGTALFGGATGLIIAYGLVKAHEKTSDLKQQLDTCHVHLRKSAQDYELLTEEHERNKTASIQKQALYEQVFNTMNSGVLVVSKDGDPLLVSRSALSLLRHEGGITTESLNVVSAFFDARPGGSISRNRSAARITLSDGTYSLFGFSTSALKDGNLVVVFQDISADVENQERKQRSEELALVGDMVSRYSHEMKNPLASILVGVKTLQRDTTQSSAHGHILRLISEEVNSLMKIVGELLESARPRKSSPGPIYVEPLLERCLDANRLQADRRGIRLDVVRFPLSTVILAHDQGMLRALSSLLHNALDACSRGDIIRLGWRELDEAGKNELVPGFSGSVASLFVEDKGGGVPDELSSTESRIFKAFVSTKASGTGLGLSVAQDIVEENGGVIVVSSLPSRGTRAEILLPIPEGRPCWDWNCDQSGDCTSCQVRATGTGYYCWKQKHGTYHADTRQWPDRCLKCNFFRASSFTPFFRSRLLVSKVD